MPFQKMVKNNTTKEVNDLLKKNWKERWNVKCQVAELLMQQNKKLPGTYINFASASRASASLSDRGIVAIPLLMDWGAADEVFEVSNEKFVNNSLKIFWI